MKTRITLSLLAGLLATSGLAIAQGYNCDASSAPMAGVAPMHQGGHGPRFGGAHHDGASMGGGPGGFAAHHGVWGAPQAANRQAMLKAQLQLTPEQENAWTTLMSALQAGPTLAQMTRPDPLAMAKLSTPERMDKVASLRAEHQAAMTAFMNQRSQAIKTFYAALSSEQQKVFDAVSLPMLGQGMGGYGHHGQGGVHPHHRS
jgi:protein CpxP